MKKFALAIIVVFAAAFAVAQGPGGPGGKMGGGRMDPKARMEKMKKDLNLTPAQVNKIEAFNKSMKPEMDKLRASKDRNGFKKLMDERMAAMKKILTKDQMAKFEKMHQRRGGMKGGPGGPPKTGGAK